MEHARVDDSWSKDEDFGDADVLNSNSSFANGPSLPGPSRLPAIESLPSSISSRDGMTIFPPSVPTEDTTAAFTKGVTAIEKLAQRVKNKGKAVERTNAKSEIEGMNSSHEASSANGNDRLIETNSKGMEFNIRFTEGEQDLCNLWVGEDESIREVKRRIRYLRPSLTIDGRPRRLRLIQLGRLLTDGTFLVPYTVQLLARRAKLVEQDPHRGSRAFLDGAKEGLEVVTREIRGGDKRELEESTSSKAEKNGLNGTIDDDLHLGKERTEAEEDARIWLHCSVGETMDDEEIEGERVQTVQLKPLQGFDRLREAGFSEEEITAMRDEFRASARAQAADGNDDEHARALEDQWMEGLTQNENITDNGTRGQFILLQGVCIGFFVPFLPLFFFKTQVFSQNMQIAILLGVAINFLFSLFRSFS